MTTTNATTAAQNHAKVTYVVYAAIRDTISNAPNITTKKLIAATLHSNNQLIPKATRVQLPNTPQQAINTLTEWTTSLEEDINVIYPNGVNDLKDPYPHLLTYYKAIINRLQNN